MTDNHQKRCRLGLCYYASNACPVAFGQRKPTTTKDSAVTVSLNVEATVEELATALRDSMSYDAQIALVAELDAQNADSEFSDRLIRLAKEIKEDLGSGMIDGNGR